MASPTYPFLAVRPTRCIYLSPISGIWKFMTHFTFSISIPRPAISVARRKSTLPFWKSSRDFILSVWDLSPCNSTQEFMLNWLKYKTHL